MSEIGSGFIQEMITAETLQAPATPGRLDLCSELERLYAPPNVPTKLDISRLGAVLNQEAVLMVMRDSDNAHHIRAVVGGIAVSTLEGKQGVITGLVTEQDYRHRGLATQLLRGTEGWLANLGIQRVRLSDGMAQDANADFWHRRGYLRGPGSPSFFKNLGDPVVNYWLNETC